MENRPSICVAQAERVKRKGAESSSTLVLLIKCVITSPRK